MHCILKLNLQSFENIKGRTFKGLRFEVLKKFSLPNFQIKIILSYNTLTQSFLRYYLAFIFAIFSISLFFLRKK
jgi:hypothetical protein